MQAVTRADDRSPGQAARATSRRRLTRDPQERAAALEHAARAVDEYERQLCTLLNVHRSRAPTADWETIASALTPPEPVPCTARTLAAEEAFESYSPGFIARVTGYGARRRLALYKRFRDAEAADVAENAARVAEWRAAATTLDARRAFARRIVARDMSAFALVVAERFPLAALTALGVRSDVRVLAPWMAEVTLDVIEDVVPRTELALRASGALSSRPFAPSKRNEIYRELVCGSALRAAREVFAALPLDTIVVHVRYAIPTWPDEPPPKELILSVVFSRTALDGLELELAAHEAIRGFDHRLRFKRTAGFTTVEPIEADSLKPVVVARQAAR